MRTNEGGARPSRTLAAIFEEAVTVLRQDLSEYGYIALCGGFTAALLATVLRYIDSPLSLAFAVIVIALAALGTLATCAAALERIQHGLQPDSGRSFADALQRAPWFVARGLPPMLVLAVGVFITKAFGDDLGRWATLPLSVIFVFAAIYLALPVPMYVAAMFSRDASPHEASMRTAAIMQGSRAFVVMAMVIALAPAELATAVALLAHFGTMTTALFAFAFVVSMPLVASMLALIHAELAPWIGQPAAQQRPRAATPQASNVAARLDRHIR
jgi:hypothetical protein